MMRIANTAITPKYSYTLMMYFSPPRLPANSRIYTHDDRILTCLLLLLRNLIVFPICPSGIPNIGVHINLAQGKVRVREFYV